MTDRYLPIAEHGLIGDQQTCALVDTTGTIDWFCAPRFDSPSVFASILDADRGGAFRLRPAEDGAVTKQLYFPDTAILITRFLTPDGVGEIADFMPISDPWVPAERHSIIRMLRVPRGAMTFDFEVAPRFDYGRATHKLQCTDQGAVFTSDHGALTLHAPVALRQRGDDVVGSITLRAGEVAGFVLESGSAGPARAPVADEIERAFRDTAGYWRNWLRRSTYTGRWRDMVYRSAITLKLLTYAPTGAPVAAATAGLPEQVGGERNWDYRYTWIRDGSFTVQALDRLGFTDDALVFLLWLRDRFEDRKSDATGPLQIMYRVDGGTDLEEIILDHLEGYRGSCPVRIGNGASDQLQLDIYGEAFDAIYHAERHQLALGKRGWNDLRAIIDWVCDNWDQPEEGLWETRGGRKPFVYGRMLCWVALDRAIRLARLGAHPAPLDRWIATRDAIDQDIVTRGWNPKVGAFVQYYGADVLDSSLLAAARLHYLSPTDELWTGTLAGIEKELVSDSLVYRYNPEVSPDGLQGAEGTFSMCTFWYVDALTRTGRIADARLVFEKMLTYANHLGLYAEEIGLTGEQLGNFPQAFTHLSLITAAVDLDRALDRAER